MKPVKRLLLVLATTALLLLAFTPVAGAQTANPAYPLGAGPDVAAGGASKAGTGSQLAFTGNNYNTEIALVGVVALVVGGGLVVMTRRRKVAVQV